MFSPASICLLVGWFVSRITEKKYCTDFHKSWTDGSHPRIDPIDIWCGSGIRDSLGISFSHF